MTKGLSDSFEDYESVNWFWWSLHLVLASKLSGLDRAEKDKELESLLSDFGITKRHKRKTSLQGVAR